MIVVYTLPNCPGCVRTKNYLAQRGMEYREVSIMEDEEAKHRLMSLGYSRAPVVEHNGTLFAGFQPERLESILST